jgi:uncharacterized protein (DUF3084 family)
MLFENSWPTPTNTPQVVGKNAQETVQAKILLATIDRLESDKESLTNTVSDLRHLLQRVAQQQEREASRRLSQTQAYQAEIDRLKLALNVSQKHSSHLSAVASFWQEHLEN